MTHRGPFQPRPFCDSVNARGADADHAASSGSVSCHSTVLLGCGGWREKHWPLCFALGIQTLEQGMPHHLLQDFVIAQKGLKSGCLR